MPLYEYQCHSCGKVHEVMQKFSDAPLESCPVCQGSVSKLMSLSSFALKGTGWYSTDYKKSGATAKSAASESAAPAGGASASPSSTGPGAPTSS